MARESNSSRFRWRLWFTGAAWCAVFVSSAVAAHKLHRFVITDPQFTFSGERPEALSIDGAQYASRARIRRVFARDFERSVFLLPLAERRRRLLAIDWVEDASVSRIWPDRVIVRVTERRPVAFVTMRAPGGRSARVLLIDADGVLLEPPAHSRFSFPVLSGITETETDVERGRKVRTLLRLLQTLGPRARDVSEVRVSGEDVTIFAQVDGRVLELLLGNGNYAGRFQNFLNHYPEIQKRAGNVTAFDLRLEDRITAKE